MYSDKYTNFAMRLHKELPEYATQINLASGWTYRAGASQNLLELFHVSEVDNPPPKIKSNSVSVPGTNGSVYMDEATGRVTFEDKTVKVVLAGSGEEYFGLGYDSTLNSIRSNLQGRLMDFTFDPASGVEWFQTGRLSVDFDFKLCTFTLTFTEVPPFRFSTDLFQKAIALRTNYEKHNNADAWHFDTDAYGTPPAYSDNPGNFAYCFNTSGREYIRTKGVGGAVGSKMLFGIQTLVGGEVWFEDNNGNKSKTYATTCTTTLSGSTSEIRMHFTCDGSYYEWKTVGGVRKYLPTIRCTYVLSNYVPINNYGEIVNLTGDGFVTNDFPSNVLIMPDVSGSAGIIIADGVASSTDRNAKEHKVPRIVLPGVEATKSGQYSRSVFCWIPSDNSNIAQTDNCGFCFIPVEVF